MIYLLYAVVLLFCFLVLQWLIRRVARSVSEAPGSGAATAQQAQARRVPLDEQIRLLEECGIGVRDPESLDQNLSDGDRKFLEEEFPYQYLLAALGGGFLPPPLDEPLSDDLLAVHKQCVHGPGAYVTIAGRMRDLADGDLPIEDLADHVDAAEGSAWLSVRLDGEVLRFDGVVNSAAPDWSILQGLAGLLQRRGSPKRFASLEVRGRDVQLIMCLTPEQRERLLHDAGLAEYGIAWL